MYVMCLKFYVDINEGGETHCFLVSDLLTSLKTQIYVFMHFEHHTPMRLVCVGRQSRMQISPSQHNKHTPPNTTK